MRSAVRGRAFPRVDRALSTFGTQSRSRERCTSASLAFAGSLFFLVWQVPSMFAFQQSISAWVGDLTHRSRWRVLRLENILCSGSVDTV